MRILLISPDIKLPGTKVKPQYVVMGEVTFLQVRAYMPPLALATVAALTPDDVEVDIWDEPVHGLVSDNTDFGKEYNMVGVTGCVGYDWRMNELGQIFRRRNVLTAVGGPAVSAAPERYRDNFDVLFIGEAEYTWPRFIGDWKAGRYSSEYRQVTKVDMAHSPLPRWDKVAADMPYYLLGGVQTTRGCPFDCEFCDVIYIYGRQVRQKPIDQVLEEVSALERLGKESIFVCDDNFMANPGYSKSLLRELISLNRSFRQPVAFNTQISLNVAKDDEMLELLADANFTNLFIGIETPNIESLIEANKPQNYRTDILADVKKIQSYGVTVRASLIVGFDHDDTTIFDTQFEFLQESGIALAGICLLQAMDGTKLWIRLHKEGRVIQIGDLRPALSTPYETNIIPAKMTRVELLSGYGDLVKRIRDWHNFEARVNEMLSQVRRKPHVKRRRLPRRLLLRFLKFIFFSMNGEMRGVTLRLLVRTLRRAPFMLGSVGRLIAVHYIEALRVSSIQEAIDEQIRLESAEGMQLQREQTVFFVPDGFREPYRAIFPQLYERVHQGLVDKMRTHDALVEAIYDFLTRWGPSFQEFEEHHRTFLYEVCDRTVARENDEVQNRGSDNMGAEGPDEMGGLSQREVAIRLKQLADEVLRSVEQELRHFQRGG